jgi:hypothetical protein
MSLTGNIIGARRSNRLFKHRIFLLTARDIDRIPLVDGTMLVLHFHARSFAITAAVVAITRDLAFFQGLFDGVRWLAFALNIVGVVLLSIVLIERYGKGNRVI